MHLKYLVPFSLVLAEEWHEVIYSFSLFFADERRFGDDVFTEALFRFYNKWFASLLAVGNKYDIRQKPFYGNIKGDVILVAIGELIV